MRFTATGDSLIIERIGKKYAGFDEVASFIARGDARITNLETVLCDNECFASSYCGGTWLKSDPEVLCDVRSFGFNLFGIANNHTMDFGYEGLYQTLKTLSCSGASYAGAGKDLDAAARAVVVDTPGGKVAFISLCSTFNDAARAGSSLGGIPGRPGLNPLRFTTECIVDEYQKEMLEKIVEETGLNGRLYNSMRQGYTPLPPEGMLPVGSVLFRAGSPKGKFTRLNKIDMERTEKMIRLAGRQARHVVVMIHSHECAGEDDREPDDFLKEFCHRCIDAGAAGVVGTGTHQMRPIEIYKNRPIFYSLGNFIFQSDSTPALPADFYERYGFSTTLSAPEAIHMRNKNGTGGLHSMEVNHLSVIPYWEIDGDRLVALRLFPLELGFGDKAGLCGLPRKAADPGKIMEYLAPLCRPYGTTLKIEGDLIEVDLQ